MIFKQITLPDNSTIYFIDNKRTSAKNFEYKYVLCNVLEENERYYYSNDFIQDYLNEQDFLFTEEGEIFNY